MANFGFIEEDLGFKADETAKKATQDIGFKPEGSVRIDPQGLGFKSDPQALTIERPELELEGALNDEKNAIAQNKNMRVAAAMKEDSFRRFYNQIAQVNKLDPDPQSPANAYDFRSLFEAVSSGAVPPPQISPVKKQYDLPGDFTMPGHPEFYLKTDPQVWTYEQAQKYVKEHPAQTPEQEAQMEVFLETKRIQVEREKAKLTGFEKWQQDQNNKMLAEGREYPHADLLKDPEKLSTFQSFAVPYVKGVAGFFTRPFGVEPFGSTFTPEEVKASEKDHPVASAVGKAIGGIGPVATAVALAPETLLGQLFAFATTGAIQQAGVEKTQGSLMDQKGSRERIVKTTLKSAAYAPLWYYTQALSLGGPITSILTRAGARGTGAAGIEKAGGATTQEAVMSGLMTGALSGLFELTPFAIDKINSTIKNRSLDDMAQTLAKNDENLRNTIIKNSVARDGVPPTEEELQKLIRAGLTIEVTKNNIPTFRIVSAADKLRKTFEPKTAEVMPRAGESGQILLPFNEGDIVRVGGTIGKISKIAGDNAIIVSNLGKQFATQLNNVEHTGLLPQEIPVEHMTKVPENKKDYVKDLFRIENPNVVDEFIMNDPDYRNAIAHNKELGQKTFVETDNPEEWPEYYKPYLDRAIKPGVPAAEGQPEVVIWMGLPGSGKTQMFKKQGLDKTHIQIDPDDAKFFVPESAQDPSLADYVHKESAYMADKLLLKKAIEQNKNIIWPLVGKNPQKIKELIQQFKDAGYKVELNFNRLSTVESKKRAYKRYLEDKRLVSTEYIDSVGEEVLDNNFQALKGLVDKFASWDVNTKFSENPKELEKGENNAEAIAAATGAGQGRGADQLRVEGAPGGQGQEGQEGIVEHNGKFYRRLPGSDVAWDFNAGHGWVPLRSLAIKDELNAKFPVVDKSREELNSVVKIENKALEFGWEKVKSGSADQIKISGDKYYTLKTPDGARLAFSFSDIYTRPDRPGVWVGEDIPSPGKITLQAIVVDPSKQGKGIGTNALNQLKDIADQSGIIISLEPTVLKEYPRNIKGGLVDFYKKRGFVSREEGDNRILEYRPQIKEAAQIQETSSLEEIGADVFSEEEFPGGQIDFNEAPGVIETEYKAMTPEDQARFELEMDDLRKTPEGNLFIAIKSLGGIKPHAKGFLKEEEAEIPFYLKNNRSGSTLDDLVAQLESYGWKFDSEDDLREAIKQQARNPVAKVDRSSLRQVIREAEKNKKLEQEILDKVLPGKRRKFIQTVKSAEKTAPEVAQKVESRYEPIKNTDTLKQAQDFVEANYNEAVELVEGPGRTNTLTNTIGIVLIDKAQAEGRWADAIRLVERLAEKNTELGQAIQALSMYERLTPEGILKYAEKQVRRAREDIKQKERLTNYEKIAKTLKTQADKDKLADKLGIPHISELVAAEMKKMAERIQTMPPGREKSIEEALLLKKIADQIPVGLGKKLSMIQTLAQLLNPKTFVRNILGNVGFQVAENISDTLGTLLDIGASLRTGKRTVYLPSATAQAKGLVQGMKEGTEEALKGISLKDTQSKYTLPKNGVFDKGVMGALEKVLRISLSATDRAFYQAAFNQSIRAQVAAAGLEEPTEEMIEKAHLLGLYRTFQDDNVISNFFVKLKKLLNLGKDFGLGDIVIKYPKTPANILARGIEYSPFGFIKTAMAMARPLLKQGPFDQEEFVRSTSRAFTGTALFVGIGAILAGMGIITGRRSKDKDVAATREGVGLRDYQINTSALKRFVMSGMDPEQANIREDDVMTTYDWFLPASIDIALGADLVLRPKENVVNKVLNLGDRVLQASETLQEQPLVRGLKVLTSRQNLAEGISETVQDIPASFVPTLLNQIRQLTDNTARNTKDPDYFTEIYKKVALRVPGLASTLPEKIDVLGRPKEMYQLGSNNPFNVFLNPAFVNKYKPDLVSKMVLDIWEHSGETVQFPRVAQAKIKMSGFPEPVELSPRQYTEFQKYIGTKTNVLFNILANNKKFLAKDNEEKAKILQGYLTDINTAAKAEILGYRPKRVSKDVITIIKEIGRDWREIKKNEPAEDIGFNPAEDLGFVAEE